MKNIAIVYHSGYGHARQQFEQGRGQRPQSARQLYRRHGAIERRPRSGGDAGIRSGVARELGKRVTQAANAWNAAALS